MTKEKRVMTFYPYDKDGKRYKWLFYRENGWWLFKDHEGNIRCLEQNWTASKPRIKMIAENYGFEILLGD